jgi:hypothetical protein
LVLKPSQADSEQPADVPRTAMRDRSTSGCRASQRYASATSARAGRSVPFSV